MRDVQTSPAPPARTDPLSRALHRVFSERLLLRSVYAERLFEDFLIAAIAAILTIRLYLHATGYPQVGGEHLHIAHMLWGGLLMLLALFLLLTSLSGIARELSAVVGGVGFGTFIDELGKFITRDHDYFFEPTFALIYIIFMALYVAARVVNRYRALSPAERLANALEISKQTVHGDLDEHSRDTALALLDGCDPSNRLVAALRTTLSETPTVDPRQPHLLSRARRMPHTVYSSLLRRSWFPRLVVAVFLVQSMSALAQVVAGVEWTLAAGIWATGALLTVIILARGRGRIFSVTQFGLAAALLAALVAAAWAVRFELGPAVPSLADWGQLIFPSVSSILVLLGILAMLRSRIEAYRLFQWAVLISILLTQVYAFHDQQLLALAGLLVNVVILLTLRYMIAEEETRSIGRPGRRLAASHVGA